MPIDQTFVETTEFLTASNTTNQNMTMDSIKCFVLPFIQGIILVVLNYILVIVGTLGNLLIIFAVLQTPQLNKRPSNILLMSLAVADLLVALCSQSIHGLMISLSTFLHQCFPELDLTYDITVSFLCCCSLFQLGIISIDRVISVLNPHKYQDLMSKKIVKRIAYGCWIASFLNACTRVPFPKENFLVGLGVFFIGYVIFIGSYGAIIYKVAQSTSITSKEGAASARERVMERRVCEAVGIVTLIFSLCWLPVFIFLILSQGKTNNRTYSWLRTLYLANSSVNFIVYSWRIQQFRRAYSRIIRRVLLRLRLWSGATPVSTGASAGQSALADNPIKSQEENKSPQTAEK